MQLVGDFPGDFRRRKRVIVVSGCAVLNGGVSVKPDKRNDVAFRRRGVVALSSATVDGDQTRVDGGAGQEVYGDSFHPEDLKLLSLALVSVSEELAPRQHTDLERCLEQLPIFALET